MVERIRGVWQYLWIGAADIKDLYVKEGFDIGSSTESIGKSDSPESRTILSSNSFVFIMAPYENDP